MLLSIFSNPSFNNNCSTVSISLFLFLYYYHNPCVYLKKKLRICLKNVFTKSFVYKKVAAREFPCGCEFRGIQPQNGGESGIRTHGTLACSPVFKTGSFDRSDISPYRFFDYLDFFRISFRYAIFETQGSM